MASPPYREGSRERGRVRVFERVLSKSSPALMAVTVLGALVTPLVTIGPWSIVLAKMKMASFAIAEGFFLMLVAWVASSDVRFDVHVVDDQTVEFRTITGRLLRKLVRLNRSTIKAIFVEERPAGRGLPHLNLSARESDSRAVHLAPALQGVCTKESLDAAARDLAQALNLDK